MLVIVIGMTVLLMQTEIVRASSISIDADSSGTLRDIDGNGSSIALFTGSNLRAGMFGGMEYRALMTFNLSVVPAGATITSASLRPYNLSVSGMLLDTDLSVYGYVTTGPISGATSIGDWQGGSLITIRTLDPIAQPPPRFLSPFDVTNHVASTFGSGVVAFRLEAEPTNTLFWFYESMSVQPPTLSVSYSLAPTPVPFGSVPLLIGLAAAFGVVLALRLRFTIVGRRNHS